MELDPAKLNEYPIKILQGYCKTKNLAVRGTRKNDYILVILAHLQKTNKDIKIPNTAKLGIDAEAVKKWEAEEERRREEERIKYEQWRTTEEERKRKAREEELREQERKRKEEEMAKLEWSERKKRGARRREIEEKRTQERSLGAVGQQPWSIRLFPHPPPPPLGISTDIARRLQGDPSSYFSRLPGPVLARCIAFVDATGDAVPQKQQDHQRQEEPITGALRSLNVEHTKQNLSLRVLTAEEMAHKGQRSLLVIGKPERSYLDQLEHAEAWVGTTEAKILVYSVNLKRLKDTRKAKWKKEQTLTLPGPKHTVRQLVQTEQRVWAMASGEEPVVFDIKVIPHC